MAETATQHIREFTEAVAPRVFGRGQGYARSRYGILSLEVAWYREDEYTWTLTLAAEASGDGRVRVQTPEDTTFQCHPSFQREEQLQSLREQLANTYSEMLHIPLC